MVFDAADPSGLAAFWAAAIGWEATDDSPDVSVAEPRRFSYPDPAVLPLVFVKVAGPKAGKNRVHLDLATASAADQAALVRRLRDLGAAPLDIGQGQVPWAVLADPEGNEFCVLEPRPVYSDTGPVAAVVVDSADPAAAAGFWIEAGGWPRVASDHGLVALRPAARGGPFLEFLPSQDVRRVKNRVHLDVAPFAGQDQGAEVARLLAAGARSADIGQGDRSWVVLADPEGNEFCVLTPR
jgi:predicted enzyme related to lactoylglutathione lyase